MTMTERTIKQDELKAVLEEIGHIIPRVNEIMNAAFPPLFTPKEGQWICVSDFSDFSKSKARVFSHMNVNNGKYECFCNGDLDETNTNTITYVYAKPQTPTQKGEG
jgi:hypothetical protein